MLVHPLEPASARARANGYHGPLPPGFDGWFGGWLDDEDIVVLYGEKTGIFAYEITENNELALLSIAPDNQDLKGKVDKRGEALRANKYD